MIRYAATIFISAFLLFQVQPMVARFILPWFGGSSLVWTTCMLFFQSALVFGYAYAHFMNRRLTPRQQWISHTLLLVIAICFLPIKPADYWKPVDASMPTMRILVLLAVSVGLPFFLLSMTGPLLQAWQSKTHPHRSPFRLFALSNFASLAALVSYPFLFEPHMTVATQSKTWSFAFIGFAVLACLSGKMFCNRSNHSETLVPETGPSSPVTERLGFFRILLWTILPMLASIQLLATTNLMTQEVGSLPFLWIVPLSLYLLSFIICFDHPRWYWRPFFYLLFFVSAVASAFVLEAGVDVPIVMQVIGYSAACFGASMCCHGELARSKPGPENLTMFYLLISIGGALGGVFVAIAAPRLFTGYYEFQIGIVAAILCCLIGYGLQVARETTDAASPDKTKNNFRQRLGFATTLFVGLLVAFFVVTSIGTQWISDHKKSVLLKVRNEYGTLTVKDYDGYRKLTNGQIEHGFQYKDDRWKMLPTSYYGPDSGLGIAIQFLADEAELDMNPGLDFGAIGLGVGTICGWCEPEDTIRYFEINPAVQDVAENQFWYLKNCEARETEIVLGDARLQLEREVERDDPRKYDVLIADAFSSDSIPMHLLTLESMQIYCQRLKPHGVLAFHVSNRFLVLENVVKELSNELEMQCVLVDHTPSSDQGLYNSSSWVLVTRNERFIEYTQEFQPPLDGKWPEEKFTARWTDDFSSILPVLRWDKDTDWFTDLLGEKGWLKKKKEEDEENGN